MEMMDSICTRVTSRIPATTREVRRDVFKDRTPYLLFDSVKVHGGTKGQNEYLSYLFTHNSPDTFGISRVRDSYYRAISSGQIQNLLPTAVFNPADSLFTLDVEATIKNNYRAGFGGYISTSTSSMLFFSGGYNKLSKNSLDCSVNAWAGQSYLAADATAKIALFTSTPSYLMLRGVWSRQKYHEDDNMFFDMSTPNFVTNYEAFGRLTYCVAAGRRGIFNISLGGGHLIDRYYRSFMTDIEAGDAGRGRDKATRTLGQLRISYDHNTLNGYSYPTAGSRFTITAMGLTGRLTHTHPGPGMEDATTKPSWLQADIHAIGFLNPGRHFALGLESNIVASTRKLPHDYSTALVTSNSFNPTSSSYNAFNPDFRADSYITGGIIPVWTFNAMLQARGTFHCFLPLRRIEEGPGHSAQWGSWLSNPRFFGEVAAVVNLPFAAVTAYANYTNTPGQKWNFGLSLGIFMLAPRFLR